MSVNGIEIKVGQKWITVDGEEVEIMELDEEDTHMPFEGSNCMWYNTEGEAPGAGDSSNLKTLIQDVKQQTSVFKEGDVVYTTRHGGGVIVRADDKSVAVKHADVNVLIHYQPQEVSFSPWQAPNHKRPIEDGYWIVQMDGDDYNIVCALGGVISHQGGLKIGEHYLKNIVYVKYLGKEIV